MIAHAAAEPITTGAHPHAGSRPALRATMFAAAAVPITATVHHAAGGRPATVYSLAAGGALSFLVHRRVLGRRERGLGPLIAALLAMQLLLHWLFTTLGPHPTDLTPTGHAHHAMAAHAHPAMAETDAGQLASTMGAGHGGHMLTMIVAHLIAAAGLGAALRHGDRLFWAAAHRMEWVIRVLRWPAGRCAPVSEPAHGRRPTTPAPELYRHPHDQGRLHHAGQIRRGPPTGTRG